MAITNKPRCDFCVWTPNSLAVNIIKRDTEFWQQKMFSKQQKIYYMYLLPEIADPVYPKGQNIRLLLNIDNM